MLALVTALLIFSEYSFANSTSSKCEYYQSANQKHRCPVESNYLENYGRKYCEKFTELEADAETSSKLKKWISETRSCLQEMLEESGRRHKWECSKLLELAFDVHPVCYKVFGVCDLDGLDVIKIGKVVVKNDFETDFEKTKRATMMQIANVATSCLSASQALSNAGELFYNIVLQSKARGTIQAVGDALEIIDRAPSTLKALEKYFSEIVASMASSEQGENRTSNNSVMVFSNMTSSIPREQYGSIGLMDAPSGVPNAEFLRLKNALLKGVTIKELRRGLSTARRLSGPNQ